MAETPRSGLFDEFERPQNWRVVHGTSQSGRMARTFLDLGFNEDEQHHKVVDGLNPHIGSVRIEINTRFAQPIRGPGLQHEEKITTADADTPFTYGDSQSIRSNHVALVGDSAGGGLTVTTILRAREQGLPLTARVFASTAVIAGEPKSAAAPISRRKPPGDAAAHGAGTPLVIYSLPWINRLVRRRS